MVFESFLRELMKSVAATLSSKQRPQDLSHITGKRLMYSYENGWVYEIYLKDSGTLEYRIYSGPVGGRWVKDQPVNVVQLGGDRRFKISWSEPTGTAVSLCIDLGREDHSNSNILQHHGVIFFPQWVHREPRRTVLFQNDHLEEMKRLRDAGPTYPIDLVDEFAEIFFVQDAGIGNEELISLSPAEFAPALERIKRDVNFDQKISQFGSRWGSRDVGDLVRKRLSFVYQNGWHHELYITSPTTIDHRIRDRDGVIVSKAELQEACIVRLLGPRRFIVSWTDPTGTCVSLNLDLDLNEIHGVHFFPNWLLEEDSLQDPNHKLRYQLDGSPTPRGPVYPLRLISEFGQISHCS